MATISDVVKMSGVSKTTVSRVLNDSPYVSETTRRQVLHAMNALGYSPNPSARRLRGQSRTMLGVIVPKITNPFFSYLVDAMETAAYERGYSVMIFQSHEDPRKELAVLNMLKSRQIDGLIMASIENRWELIEPFTKYGPIVFCNEYDDNSTIPMIRLDQCQGTLIAIRHLIERGHQKIAYCTGGLFAEQGKDKDRNQGYQMALREAGLQIHPKWIFLNKHTINDGRDVMEQILAMDDRPTAIFTGSDEIASGIIRVAKDHGVQIPSDIAVVGFDDQPIAELVDPTLTTVRQPVNLMGRKAMDVLIDSLSDQTQTTQIHELPVELVVRQST